MALKPTTILVPVTTIGIGVVVVGVVSATLIVAAAMDWRGVPVGAVLIVAGAVVAIVVAAGLRPAFRVRLVGGAPRLVLPARCLLGPECAPIRVCVPGGADVGRDVDP